MKACFFRAWFPENCQDVIAELQRDIDSGRLRDKMNLAMYSVAYAGRESGGASPMESFQVYVLSYITFFNEVATGCNDISWGTWWWDKQKFTIDIRKQLNALTRSVNEQLRLAAKDLEGMGVIFIDSLDDLYGGHRYCEDRHTSSSSSMMDYDTWFWSPYQHFNTPSEGPGDPNHPYVLGDDDPAKLILDFVFPGQNIDPQSVSPDSPAWTWEGAEKYPSYEALSDAIQQGNFTMAATPLNYLRSFHPKGTAYGFHKIEVFLSIMANREEIAAKTLYLYTKRCKNVSSNTSD